ncbi:MAG TPA: thermonuclease family protein [candidate division Zixibacteria bacterium]
MSRRQINSRRLIYLSFVLALVLLVYLFYAPSKQVGIKEVIDGDTIELESGERVRYIGIDTPEKDQPFFGEATRANRELLKKGKYSLEYDNDREDDWGRTLAYVWIDTLMVNAELVREGLASVYLISPNFKHKEELIAFQNEARAKGSGIWSIPVSPEKYYVASRHSRGLVFHRPGCQWAKKIAKDNLIRFETKDQALDLGYSPCRTCKP